MPVTTREHGKHRNAFFLLSFLRRSPVHCNDRSSDTWLYLYLSNYAVLRAPVMKIVIMSLRCLSHARCVCGYVCAPHPSTVLGDLQVLGKGQLSGTRVRVAAAKAVCRALCQNCALELCTHNNLDRYLEWEATSSYRCRDGPVSSAGVHGSDAASTHVTHVHSVSKYITNCTGEKE